MNSPLETVHVETVHVDNQRDVLRGVDPAAMRDIGFTPTDDVIDAMRQRIYNSIELAKSTAKTAAAPGATVVNGRVQYYDGYDPLAKV